MKIIYEEIAGIISGTEFIDRGIKIMTDWIWKRWNISTDSLIEENIDKALKVLADAGYEVRNYVK